MISFDTSDLDNLEADLGKMSVPVLRNVRKAVEITARKIKDDAKSIIAGHRFLKAYPASITYDMKYGLTSVTAIIGPDKNRPQGALGNIIEYGSVNNPPVKHLGPALEKNEEDFVAGLGIAVGDAL